MPRGRRLGRICRLQARPSAARLPVNDSFLEPAAGDPDPQSNRHHDGVTPMSLSLVSSALTLAAVLSSQPASGRSERPLSAEEVARLESPAPAEHPPGDFRVLPGGRGLLPARRQGHHLPGRSQPADLGLPDRHAQPVRVSDLHADLAPDAKPLLVSTGKGPARAPFTIPMASRSSSARPT